MIESEQVYVGQLREESDAHATFIDIYQENIRYVRVVSKAHCTDGRIKCFKKVIERY